MTCLKTNIMECKGSVTIAKSKWFLKTVVSVENQRFPLVLRLLGRSSCFLEKITFPAGVPRAETGQTAPSVCLCLPFAAKVMLNTLVSFLPVDKRLLQAHFSEDMCPLNYFKHWTGTVKNS